MYQPIVGRFMSVDPLSADGVDVIRNTGWFGQRLDAMRQAANKKYGYAENNPVRVVDPSGMLTIKPLAAFRPICGSFALALYDFILDKPAPCTGYIVQKITINCDQDDTCALCPKDFPPKPNVVYWEAWQVDAGQQMWWKRVLGIRKWTDIDYTPTGVRTCGAVLKYGEVKFYCENKYHPHAKGVGTGDLGLGTEEIRIKGPFQDPDWDQDKHYGPAYCDTTPGPLPSTGNEPSWWRKPPVEGPEVRTTTVFWNCCVSDPELVFDPQPAPPLPSPKKC